MGNSLLQEVDGSFRLHDLLLDFIGVTCQGEDALVREAVASQCRYLGRLAVVRGYSDKGEFCEGFFSLMRFWQKLIELSGNDQLEMDAYNASLGELGEDESEDAAHVFWSIGKLLDLQVGEGCELFSEAGVLEADVQTYTALMQLIAEIVTKPDALLFVLLGREIYLSAFNTPGGGPKRRLKPS